MGWQARIIEDGFAVLPGVFSEEYLDDLLQGIDASPLQRSRAGIRHALKLTPVADLARHQTLIELSRCALGERAFPYRATLFDKSRAANWLVVWHQDTALPLRSRHEIPGWGPWSIKEGIQYAHAPSSALSQILALRISLDDSNAENGPLRVLPGTHTLGVLTDDAVRELSLRMPHVDCIVPKGGVLATRPLLVHSSSKSQTDMPRRVLHIEYAASDSIVEPLELAIA
jgi:ectoine hydroxylase-related dioxygenase (phytanoyl-CoA dioxygenase family)